jgi:L-asparaginase
VPTFDIINFDPPIDSSDMEPAGTRRTTSSCPRPHPDSSLCASCVCVVPDWVSIATVIEKNYWDYQGFLVIHGTDTMSVRTPHLSALHCRAVGRVVSCVSYVACRWSCRMWRDVACAANGQ